MALRAGAEGAGLGWRRPRGWRTLSGPDPASEDIVTDAPEATSLEDLHGALTEADALELDERLKLLRSVEERLSEALEGLDGL
jgi:hypothetical protein